METFLTIATLFFCASPAVAEGPDSLRHPMEKHLKNIRQLTFGGTNAEAYFSFDDKNISFQSTRPPYGCDQIFVMNADGSGQTLISTGKGITTCAYIFPGGKKLLYASTHGAGSDCIPRPDRSKGYLWGVYHAYDLYTANLDGTGQKPLFASAGYDAEATISPVGDRIIFTSSRDGDLELYSMKLDGSDIRRITNELGYDGGAFYSWDGKRIVYRGNHPKGDSAVAEYKSLLAEQLVKPSKMEIFISDADGKNRKQLTSNGAANFAPFFLPGNKGIIFASNMKDPGGRSFHLYVMNEDGSHVEQVTHGGVFNSFPMFTRDGKRMVFVSDRNAKGRYEFNIFLADWVD